jgi:hypothetical protein
VDYLQRIKHLDQDTPKTRAEWLEGWHDLAVMTYGITATDPRCDRVLRWLNIADTAFILDSWSLFEEARAMLESVTKEAT